MAATLTLIQPVRARVVLRYLGQLTASLAGMVAVPLGVALLTGDREFALRLAIVFAVLAAAFVGLGRVRAPSQIQTNEALVVIALLFIAGAGAMTWPFMAHGVGFADALFESTSAITTTGLSTLATVEGRGPAFLLARAWMQWYGGLAIVVLALALILSPGVVAKRLAQGEVETDDLVGGTRRHAIHALTIYVGLTVAAVALLWLAGAGPFDALVHALAAISTGGFSNRDASIAALDGWLLRGAVTLAAIAGAISFMLYYAAMRRGWRHLLADEEARTLVLTAAFTAAGVGVFMALDGGWGWREIVANAPLLAFSAQTTAGFATLDVATLPDAAKLALMGSMLVGGDAGSTAGGIKILRFLVLLRLVHQIVLVASVPRHAVTPMRVAGRRLAANDVETALTIVLLYFALVGLGWLAFAIAGRGGLDALFDVVSAASTTGLSAGVTGPDLAPALKAVLVVVMLAGRLEVVALLVLFYPRSWIGGGRG